MTRYCVQITRTYEVQAEDEEHAKRLALADDWVQIGTEPTIVVTDLDAIDEASEKQQGRSAADCRAHNPEVGGSKDAIQES